MKPERAQQIYESSDNYAVQLDDGPTVWIENVDVENGVATVQVGMNPTDTQTVAIDRLHERQ
ncbi:MAG: H-type small acid-soluble spore protein [Candidatus Cohnella colombiensis]|uniref:H-type small acid-soluble spore protein n=1 Tax=Candidatus Cohnella colombiensis TaxID=3121368 RepID=A0AA95JC94_9BACL|nr:MAG: H-type small acid-soluble spore protein [Cohnella sp.]